MKPGTARLLYTLQPCIGKAADDSKILHTCSLMCFSLRIGLTVTASLLACNVLRH